MLSTLNRIQKYTIYKPTLLKLEQIYNYGLHSNGNKIIEQSMFLHKELPVRLSHRISELQTLPQNLLKIDKIEEVHDLYVKSFNNILDHPIPNNIDKSEKFTELLSNIRDNHTDLEFNISTALQKYKNVNEYHLGNADDKLINNILDNFYMSRIGIRFLVGQHIMIQNKKDVCESKNTGMITPNCNPYKILKDAISEVNNLFSYELDDIPEVEISGNLSYTFQYIPAHLYYIFFELLKNAMKASVESKTTKPIKINIHVGNDDIIINIIDYGKSFSKKDLSNIFNYTYTTTPLKDQKNNSVYNRYNPIVSGFGHGCGLSRIYARYFGGDLLIVPIEGLQTEAIIYINKLDSQERI